MYFRDRGHGFIQVQKIQTSMLPLAVRRLELVVLMLKEKKRHAEKEREIHVQSNGNLGDRGKWPW